MTPVDEELKPVECPKCKNGVARDLHVCPWKTEVDNDFEEKCTCCSECEHECLMDT